MRTLVYFQAREMRFLISSYLDGQMGIDVELVELDGEASLALKKSVESIHLVVCEYNDSSQAWVKNSLKLYPNLQFFCFSDKPQVTPVAGQPRLHFLSESNWVGSMNQLLAESFNKGEAMKMATLGYCKIMPELLFFLTPLPSALCVRISDEKFVRVMSGGASFDQADYDNLVATKGFKNFYIKFEEVPNFFNSGLAMIRPKKGPSSRALSQPSVGEADQAQVSRTGQMVEKTLESELEDILVQSKGLGFNKDVQELTKKSVLSTIKFVRNSPGLSKLMLSLSKEKHKYISTHSMLLAYVSCAVASQLEWRSDSTYQKLTLAAFLHDSSLEDQELAKIQTMKELYDKKEFFTNEEMESFRQHPAEGAAVASRFHETPPDVDAIIFQHHERPDGKGFPRGLNHLRIGPLAAVFIVSHELVSYLIDNRSIGPGSEVTKAMLDKFILYYQDKYQSGTFKKILQAIHNIQA